MSRKIIITKWNNRRFLLDTTDLVVNGISVISDDTSERVGNIYIGRVENVVKNINAAFVEVKKGVKCYYSLNDNKNHIFLNQKNNDKVNIGDRILVQVCREAIKTKPATVTSKIEVPGKYIVVSADVNGVLVSSKIKKKPETAILKAALEDMIHLEDSSCTPGIILRTNSINASLEDVVEESQKLIGCFTDLFKKAQFGMFYDVLYTGAPEFCQYIDGIPMNELEYVMTDQQDLYGTIQNHVTGLKNGQLKFYDDVMLSLDKLYSMETVMKHATDKKVWLKSGGYLVIEQTEALTVVDVNSGKQTGKNPGKAGNDDYLEETFVKTNKEAAIEIANQLRLRNISGIIIVDFINMKKEVSRNELLTIMNQNLKKDRVPASVIDITKLGLVEITRKNNGKCLAEQLGRIEKVDHHGE